MSENSAMDKQTTPPDRETKSIFWKMKQGLTFKQRQWVREQVIREQWVSWWDDDSPQAEKTLGVKHSDCETSRWLRAHAVHDAARRCAFCENFHNTADRYDALLAACEAAEEHLMPHSISDIVKLSDQLRNAIAMERGQG